MIYPTRLDSKERAFEWMVPSALLWWFKTLTFHDIMHTIAKQTPEVTTFQTKGFLWNWEHVHKRERLLIRLSVFYCPEPEDANIPHEIPTRQDRIKIVPLGWRTRVVWIRFSKSHSLNSNFWSRPLCYYRWPIHCKIVSIRSRHSFHYICSFYKLSHTVVLSTQKVM